MKGVILAGGQGTRLRPFTKLINKHLLPVYEKPLIYYPLLTLKNAGIKEVLVTSGKEALPDFKRLLGKGEEFGLKISYKAQDGAKGIAHALGLAEKFAQGSKIAVILGDNIFMNHSQIKRGIQNFEKENGAKFFLKKVHDPERFGVAHVARPRGGDPLRRSGSEARARPDRNRGGKILSIVEKPKKPKTNLAVTGLYLYDPDVFSIVKKIKPSARGELEITDVNNHYAKAGLAKYEIVNGDWIDAGSFDSLLEAAVLMMRKDKEIPKLV